MEPLGADGIYRIHEVLDTPQSVDHVLFCDLSLSLATLDAPSGGIVGLRFGEFSTSDVLSEASINVARLSHIDATLLSHDDVDPGVRGGLPGDLRRRRCGRAPYLGRCARRRLTSSD